MTDELTLIQPDDWHVHLRDDVLLQAVLPETARHFGRALVMPNLVPPVKTGGDAARYRARILAACPKDMSDFIPLMTLYLTEDTNADDLERAYKQGIVIAAKLYPAGATTNSASGVRDFDKIRPVLERMASIGMPLCVHGEVTNDDIDIFDRESVFIDRILDPLRRKVPDLRVVMEHITTSHAADYVTSNAGNLAATITTHHLIITRNHMLVGGIKPHYYCLPVAKRAEHRDRLIAAAVSKNKQFFLGTDSAPHLDTSKQSACGCAGIFSATNTLSCLAEVFETQGAMDALETFTSLSGPAFYGLKPSEKTITLRKGPPVKYPKNIATSQGPITIFDPGFDLHWRVVILIISSLKFDTQANKCDCVIGSTQLCR